LRIKASQRLSIKKHLRSFCTVHLSRDSVFRHNSRYWRTEARMQLCDHPLLFNLLHSIKKTARFSIKRMKAFITCVLLFNHFPQCPLPPLLRRLYLHRFFSFTLFSPQDFAPHFTYARLFCRNKCRPPILHMRY